ncbi:sugar kinase [Streptosporangiaceae bacterium NEAU-GS5]|nr:sugar kinase [Streptosporangiaceae bacterium NEAU-GS5]
MGLLVIGDVATDVVARHGGPVEPGTDTAADIVLRPGGSGANTAAWAVALGADARLLARAGYDTAGWHLAELTRAGVTSELRVDDRHPTAVVISLVDATGERTFLTNRGAGARIGIEDWSDDLLAGVRLLHVSGYTLFADSGLRLVRHAVDAALAAGATVSVDPASTGFLREFGPARFARETRGASIILPNLAEALLLTGAAAAEPAAQALSAAYGTAVVKLGAEGALLAVEGRIVARAASPVREVVDSTGAGDAFAAGFLAALLSGSDPAAALQKGCDAGATAVAQVGGRPAAHGGPIGFARPLPY